MSWKFELAAGPFTFTEGPAWDGSGVFFTDIPKSRILRYNFATGGCSEYRTGTNRANGLMLDKSGRLHACEGDARRVVRYDADRTVVLADCFEGKALNSPNDLAFDAAGRLYFTDPRYGAEAYSGTPSDMELGHFSVYRLDPVVDDHWEITRVVFDTTSPNGVLVSPDQKWLYVAESKYGENEKRELRAYPIGPDGSLAEHLVLHNFYPHRGIDGMCLDTEGNIVATAGWAESGPGPMIYVFSPNGRVLETHPLPAGVRPTNCTFGGPDLTTLFVTVAGCLYRAQTDRKGYLIYPPG